MNRKGKMMLQWRCSLDFGSLLYGLVYGLYANERNNNITPHGAIAGKIQWTTQFLKSRSPPPKKTKKQNSDPKTQ